MEAMTTSFDQPQDVLAKCRRPCSFTESENRIFMTGPQPIEFSRDSTATTGDAQHNIAHRRTAPTNINGQ